jgi:Xaa-Pro dipeptidase
MALPFEIAEYEARIERARAAMRDARLDLLLLFHQESLYYLFGYDQIGYWVYQTVVLPADGSAPTAICRRADELMIRESPFIKEIRPWMDDSHVNPGAFTVEILRERHGLSARRRIGIEKKSHALLPYYYDLLREQIPDGVDLVDASDLVTELRLIKSPAELAYMRRAAQIMDRAFTAAFDAARPGARECDVNAEVLHTLSSLGADYPAVAPPIASGSRTLTQTHGAATERIMQHGDPFTIEIGAPYKRYHSVAAP